MFCMKIGVEGLVLQNVCYFLTLTNMGNSAYFVQSTTPRAFSVSFYILYWYVTDVEDVHVEP